MRYALESRRTAIGSALALILASCAPPPATLATPAPDAGRIVRIEMSEFAFSPPLVILAAGEAVTLVFTNVGALEHEFMAGSGVVAGKGYQDDWLARAQPKRAADHSSGHAGIGVKVGPHASAKLTLVVPSETGQLEFGCFAEGHYEGGMHGVIVVAGVAGATATPRTPAPAATVAPSMSGHPAGMEEEQH